MGTKCWQSRQLAVATLVAAVDFRILVAVLGLVATREAPVRSQQFEPIAIADVKASVAIWNSCCSFLERRPSGPNYAARRITNPCRSPFIFGYIIKQNSGHMLLARSAVMMEDLDRTGSLDFLKWDVDGFLVVMGSVKNSKQIENTSLKPLGHLSCSNP